MANLQNYTSGISADRSTAFIQRQVIDRGAKFVQLELGHNKEVVAISFQLAVSGKDVQGSFADHVMRHITVAAAPRQIGRTPLTACGPR